MSMQRPRGCGRVLFVMLVIGFVALALLSHTTVGQLVGPLAPTATAAHTGVRVRGADGVAVTMVGIFRMGCTMTRRLRAGRARARRAPRRALRRERGPHARARGHRRAPRARGEEPARGHQGPLDAHGAQRRPTRRPPSASPSSPPRPIACRRSSTASSRSRAASTTCSVAPTKPYEIARELARPARDARRRGGRHARGARRRGARARRRRAKAPPGAPQPRPQRDAGVAARLDGARSTVARATATARGSRCAIDRASGMTPEVLDRIRKPYFTTKEGGSGLGVAVARGHRRAARRRARVRERAADGHDGDRPACPHEGASPCTRAAEPAAQRAGPMEPRRGSAERRSCHRGRSLRP